MYFNVKTTSNSFRRKIEIVVDGVGVGGPGQPWAALAAGQQLWRKKLWMFLSCNLYPCFKAPENWANSASVSLCRWDRDQQWDRLSKLPKLWPKSFWAQMAIGHLIALLFLQKNFNVKVGCCTSSHFCLNIFISLLTVYKFFLRINSFYKYFNCVC